MAPPIVRYELVPPCHRFQFMLPDGSDTVSIEDAGYETDDPDVIRELDMHPEHVVRSVPKKGR